MMQPMLLLFATVGLSLADEPVEKSPPEPWSGSTVAIGAYGPAYGAPKPATMPLSLTENLEFEPFARQVRLGPVDVTGLLNEDLANTDPCLPRRIGIGREVQLRIEDGQWNTLPDGGGLWTISLVSEAAVGVRLLFSSFDLPAGAEVRLMSPLNLNAVDGPFERRGPFGDGQFWSTVLGGEEVYLEYHVPAGTPPVSTLPFLVGLIQHLYHDPWTSARAGDCHNDVSCYPQWSQARDSVARLDFSDDSATWSCTGQLVQTLASDFTPYILTAYHCVSQELEARSAVAYWRFQAPACNEPPPNPWSVPTSTQGAFVAGDPAGDLSLIMMLGEVPAGSFWSGWSAEPVPDGAACASIHHPEAEFKRISFGTKTGEESGKLRIDWSSGVTEMGSSGAGAFLDIEGQTLVGVLSCGPSYCGAGPSELHDFYGSLRYAYTSLAPALQAGTDDPWEPNGLCASAPVASPGHYQGLVVKGVDEDWYRVRSDGCGEVSVTLLFADVRGDIDVELYDACGGNVVAASRGSGNIESLTYAPGLAAEFWLRVYLNSGTRNLYDMTVLADGVNVGYEVPAGVPIPDANAAGIQHSFFVPDHFLIADLNVGVTIVHTWNGDLEVLLGHEGVSVALINRPGYPQVFPYGYGNEGLDVILDDSAATSIEEYDSRGPMVVGTFRPNSPIYAFNGQDAYGTWTLSVSDRAAIDTGSLEQWALYVTRERAPGLCECAGDGDAGADGDVDFADFAAFQGCFNGAAAGPVGSDCLNMELECDGDVDLGDWEIFRGLLSGPQRGGISFPL